MHIDLGETRVFFFFLIRSSISKQANKTGIMAPRDRVAAPDLGRCQSPRIPETKLQRRRRRGTIGGVAGPREEWRWPLGLAYGRRTHGEVRPPASACARVALRETAAYACPTRRGHVSRRERAGMERWHMCRARSGTRQQPRHVGGGTVAQTPVRPRDPAVKPRWETAHGTTTPARWAPRAVVSPSPSRSLSARARFGGWPRCRACGAVARRVPQPTHDCHEPQSPWPVPMCACFTVRRFAGLHGTLAHDTVPGLHLPR